MNSIRNILIKILGEKKYLWLLAYTFQRVYRSGLAGKNYQDIYFLKKIIEPGFNCVDIGAHLGYYTLELSRLVKGKGKVLAIEPMTKFYNTLVSLLTKENINNVVLYKLALGGNGEYVEMGIPEVNKAKKFAYARVMETSTHLQYLESEKVKNEIGDKLFMNLSNLDFIKCDVEGLEVSVFSSMLETLKNNHPILLCELAEKAERVKLFGMIAGLDYKAYILRNKKLYPIDVYGDEKAISHNHYFIPAVHEKRLAHLIAII